MSQTNNGANIKSFKVEVFQVRAQILKYVIGDIQ